MNFQENLDKYNALMLMDGTYENKMRYIRNKFKSLTRPDNIMMWSGQFHHNISNFDDNLEGFDPQNLQKLFRHFYESKEQIFVIILRSLKKHYFTNVIMLKCSNSLIIGSIKYFCIEITFNNPLRVCFK